MAPAHAVTTQQGPTGQSLTVSESQVSGKKTITVTGKGFDEPEFAEVNSASFKDAAAQALIRRCQAGSTVTIGEIKVLEPGGGTRKLDQNITFILQ